MNEKFNSFANRTSTLAGRAYTFIGAVLLIVVWLISGPFLKFSSTWQLIINTVTTLITFLMVFLLQNSQNRDNAALHIKEDANAIVLKRVAEHLGLSVEDVYDVKQLTELESLPDVELENLQKKYQSRIL